jgi:outer membrane protein assembly factor BamB
MMLTYAFLLVSFVGDVWPAFLGAGATPQSDTQLPLSWSPSQGILWQAPIEGHGQSSPVVWNDLVVVSSVDGPNKERCIVTAFSLSRGELLWTQTIDSSDPVENSLYVSRAAPTPVVDADRIVVFFESGDIVAFDHAGRQQWKRSIGKDYGKFRNKFGLGSSLAQTEKSVFVLVDDEGPSYLLALDKATGATQWKKERTSRRSWSSPATIRFGNLSQVVVSSNGSVDGYAPETGELLWSFTDVGGNTGTTPIEIGQGKLLIAAAGGREGENVELAKRSNLLLQVNAEGAAWKAEAKWRNDEVSPSWGSPIAHRGCAYWVNSVGVVFCVDMETGKTHYKQRIKQSCWATPIAVGERIYFFGKGGITSVIQAGAEFRVLSENELWDPDTLKAPADAGANESSEERRRAAATFAGPTVYGVAMADSKFIVRIGDRLFCIGSSSGSK